MRNIAFLLFLAPFAAHSQKIENAKAEATGEKIIITYDLIDGEASDRYTVSLFGSQNNFNAPLAKLTGDVGQDIRMGRGKRIEWDSKAELGKYKGPLSFEIEVKVIALLSLKSSILSAKRGKSLPIQWRGGDRNQNVKIELLKAGVMETVLVTTSNNGQYEWNVPSNQKPGRDYSLRLANGKETVSSQAFAIKPKLPMVVKVLPVVAIGAVVLLMPKSSPENDTPSNPSKLIGPPEILD